MKLLLTSILVSVGLLTGTIGASAQSLVVANGTANPACGNASFILALSGCSGCTITRWEELNVPANAPGPITVLQTYPGSQIFTCNLSAPNRKHFRPVFTRSGIPGEFNIGWITVTTDVAPIVGTLSTPTTAFLGSGSGQLTLTGAKGNVSWSPALSSVVVNSETITGNFSITNSTDFTATVSSLNGGCPAVSSGITIKVYKTGVLTGTSPLTEGEKLNLTSSGNVIRWEYSTDAGSTWINFDYASYKNGTITGDKLADSHEIWTNTRFRVLTDIGPFGTAYSNILDVIHVPYTQTNASLANGGNYVRAQDVVVSGITNPESVNGLVAGQKRQATTFQDGYGRVVQQNIQKATPLQKDLVAVTSYDSKGRQAVQYLPYVSAYATGDYRTTAFNEQSAYYANGTADKVTDSPYPFAKSTFDSSPIGRLREAGNVGQQWQPGSGHTTRIVYSNNDADEIRIINADLTSPGFYTVNELSKLEATDPDGKKTQALTDKAGRTIVARTQLDETVDGKLTPWLETYYVYNTNGSVKYIIPPKGVAAIKLASWAITTDLRNQYFHQFVYDKFGRPIEKKVPGQAWSYYCYDRFDRLVLMQDDYTRSLNKWFYIKYDRKNRPVMQGLYTNTTYTTRADLQLNVIDPLFAANTDKYYEDRGTASHGYTNQCFPTTGTQVLTVNYYDSYDFDFNGTADYAYTSQGLANENTPATAAQVRGLPTGSKRLVLGATPAWLYNYVFYNSRGQAIQALSNNHLRSAIDNLSTVVYDFEGKTLTSKTYHNAGTGKVTTVINKMLYDHMGRITHVYQNNNAAAKDQLVAKYEYNELGQLVDKKLHETSAGNNTFLQSVDFRYSIQGWLTSINNAQITSDNGVSNDETTDYFGMELLYEKVQSGLTSSTNALFNGNISAVKWKAPGTASGVADQRSYKFTYDKANRFKTAVSQISTTATVWTKEASALNESVTSYDLNGNIIGLQRSQRKHMITVSGSSITIGYGNELIDNLTYTYVTTSADQLLKVTDATNRTEGFNNGTSGTGNDFTYNTMGSLLTDNNTGITSNISYNEFGKPVLVAYSDGRKVEYVYDAAGTKLTMKTYKVDGTLKSTTDYVSGFVYENGVLSFFGSPEGRVVRNASGALEYQYAIADHQGNTRMVFSSVNTSETPLASFENMTADATKFKNLTTNSQYWVNAPSAANNTPGGSYSLRLNSTYNATGNAPGIAAVKSLSVVPGDVVSLEVYGYYVGSSGFGSTSQAITALISSLVGSVTTGMPASEAGAISSGVSSAYTTFGGAPNQGDAAPSAYLNYILLDKNYKLLDMGWQAVPTTANGTRQKIMFTPRNIKEPGYMYVYLSYEGDGTNWVYFDDLKITHTKSNVVQYNEYYPFGLQTGNSWTRENSSNNFLYNAGSELNQTTGLYETAFRGYDAALGRFMQVDPLATKFASYSAYHYAGNNPVMLNDPTGADFTVTVPDGSRPGYWQVVTMKVDEPTPSYAGREASENYKAFLTESQAFYDYAASQRNQDAATQQWVQNIYNSVPNGTNAQLRNTGQGSFDMWVEGGWQDGNSVEIIDGKEYYTEWSFMKYDYSQVQAPSQTSGGFSQYDIPVWGAAGHAADAFQDGRYLDALVWEVNGFTDMFAVEALYKLAATKLTTLYLSRQAAKRLPETVFSSKAPTQVTPGVIRLFGQYIDDLGRVQPWKASYDRFGRIIERTDWNAANKGQNIDAIHHHLYNYLSKGQVKSIDHISGIGPTTGW